MLKYNKNSSITYQRNICNPKLDIKYGKIIKTEIWQKERSRRYAVKIGKHTDIPDVRNSPYRFTILERCLPHITARKLRSVVLKLLKYIGFIFNYRFKKLFTDLLNGGILKSHAACWLILLQASVWNNFGFCQQDCSVSSLILFSSRF